MWAYVQPFMYINGCFDVFIFIFWHFLPDYKMYNMFEIFSLPYEYFDAECEYAVHQWEREQFSPEHDHFFVVREWDHLEIFG